jgi:hypothetical protein
VTVNTGGGTPRIALDIGGTTKYATYLDNTSGSNLRFRYTVESSLNDNDGIGVTASIDLNGGTIRDSVALNLTPLTFTVGSTAGILVDSLTPYATGTATIPTSDTYVTEISIYYFDE